MKRVPFSQRVVADIIFSEREPDIDDQRDVVQWQMTGAYAPGPVNRSSARLPGHQRVAGRTRLRHEVGGPYRQLQAQGGGHQAVGGAARLVAHGDTHGLVAHAAGRERHR